MRQLVKIGFHEMLSSNLTTLSKVVIANSEALNDNTLTHLMPKLSLYRHQSIDLQRKSIKWFLYDDDLSV